MSFKEKINLIADLLSIALSIIAIVGIFAAHRHGIFDALHDVGMRARHGIEAINIIPPENAPN
ncbi:MAG: hypothetical protein LBR41_00770 [Rickettsiales bacterium]|jgi:hypothetical protein|nr:hypothetical protein [Rickettsiales bacterium]